MVYEEILVLADPEWKASPGSAGNRGNIRSNASLDITRPFMATSVEFSRDHVLPSYETQASPGAYTNGSPSHTPYVSGEDTSIRTENRALGGIPSTILISPAESGRRAQGREIWLDVCARRQGHADRERLRQGRRFCCSKRVLYGNGNVRVSPV